MERKQHTCALCGTMRERRGQRGPVIGGCRGTGHTWEDSKSHVDGCWVAVPTTSNGGPGPGVRALGAIKFNNTNFYGYIRDLLIKTNSMIYICYIYYGGNAACVLAVRDDELSMGDNEEA